MNMQSIDLKSKHMFINSRLVKYGPLRPLSSIPTLQLRSQSSAFLTQCSPVTTTNLLLQKYFLSSFIHMHFRALNSRNCFSLVFLPLQILQSKRRSQGLSLDTIYHCLNRTVLYQLCRPHKTVAQQVALLDALRVLTVNRNLVLGPGNHDQDFVACLAHCFICLHSGRYVLYMEAAVGFLLWLIAADYRSASITPAGAVCVDTLILVIHTLN